MVRASWMTCSSASTDWITPQKRRCSGGRWTTSDASSPRSCATSNATGRRGEREMNIVGLVERLLDIQRIDHGRGTRERPTLESPGYRIKHNHVETPPTCPRCSLVALDRRVSTWAAVCVRRGVRNRAGSAYRQPWPLADPTHIDMNVLPTPNYDKHFLFRRGARRLVPERASACARLSASPDPCTGRERRARRSRTSTPAPQSAHPSSS